MLKWFQKNKQPITVGMQISSGYLSLLILDRENSSKPVLKGYTSYKLDSPEAQKEVAAQVKHYLHEHNIHQANCCFVLDDTDYQLLSIDPPNVPDEELTEAVKWKVKDLIDDPIADVYVDVYAQPKSPQSINNIANVVVVHKDIIRKITSLVDDMDLSLVAIDIPEMSYRNYLEKTEYHDKSVALVLIKENFGKLIVVQKSDVLFSRSFSIHYNAGLFDDLPESDIVLELQRSLDYYERQLKQIVPTLVLIVGESVTDDKITDSMRESFNQSVLVENIDHLGVSDEDSLSTGRFVAAYGGALRQGLCA